MYKAVFLDLDGTLLDDKKNVSQENKNAIQYVMEKGGQVYLASGRSLNATKKYRDMLNLSRYIIYANGAGIYDCEKNTTISITDMKKQVGKQLYNYAIENNICIRIDTINGRYISKKEYKVHVDDIVLDGNINKIIEDKEILQISLVSREQIVIEKTVEYIEKNIMKEDISIEDIFKTGENNDFFAINAINPRASKGNAIAQLCKILQISVSDVIAFGDGMNDTSMLSAVGLGVAMGNAKEEVKEKAQITTLTNNENGVAKILFDRF